MADELPITSYALLGQLALRPWSVYDMTRNTARTLHWFWPRAESVLYAEMKRLARLGMAEASATPGDRGRDRTVYALTARGREALGAWLATTPGGTTTHSEPLLRVHLAPWGTKQDLVAALEAAQREAEDLLRVAVTVGLEFAEGHHQFQDQVHVRAILFDALWTNAMSRLAWAERSLASVRAWRSIHGSERARQEGLALIEAALAGAPPEILGRLAP